MRIDSDGPTAVSKRPNPHTHTHTLSAAELSAFVSVNCMTSSAKVSPLLPERMIEPGLARVQVGLLGRCCSPTRGLDPPGASCPVSLSLSPCTHATGVGGNLVAIQASRISTYLHFWSVPGVLPFKMKEHWPNPCVTFFSSGAYKQRPAGRNPTRFNSTC